MGKWVAIQSAYGDCTITYHATKSDAVTHIRDMHLITEKPCKLDMGYELDGRHIVCKKKEMALMGY